MTVPASDPLSRSVGQKDSFTATAMMSGTSRKCHDSDLPNSPDFIEQSQKELKSEGQIQKAKQDEGNMQSAAVDAPLPSSSTPSSTDPPCQPLDLDQEVKYAIDTIRKFLAERERSGRTYLEIPLTYEAYNKLKEKYESDTALVNNRYRYLATKQTFVLLMKPCILHADILTSLCDAFNLQVNPLKQSPNPVVSTFTKGLRQLQNCGVDLIPFRGRRGDVAPDFYYIHDDAAFPGVVIEVANTQLEKSLGDVARELIFGTKGEISVVIGLKVNYPNSQRATLSQWRSHWTKLAGQMPELSVVQLINGQEFRLDNGSPNPDCPGIRLSLSDFAPSRFFVDELQELVNHPTRIHISAADLCEYVGAARALEKKVKKAREEILRNGEKIIIKDKPSEPEELSPEREAKFQEDEARVEELEDLEDSDYTE